MTTRKRRQAPAEALAPIAVSFNARDVAALQADAEGLALALADLTIDTPDDYTQADAILTTVVQRKDAMIAMRGSATGPLYAGVRVVEGWFRPVLDAFDSCERGVKGAMSSFVLGQVEAERQARELAQAAATSGDAETLVEALTVAAEAAEKPEARASVGFTWGVKAIDVAELPKEWMLPDEKRIAGFGRLHADSDTPPEIPGVTFERVANIGARR